MSQQKKLEISDRVRAYRERMNLSQEELGNQLGVSGNYIYLIESGKKIPGDSLLKLFDTVEAVGDFVRDAPISENEDKPNPYSHLQIETLQKSLADLSAKLPSISEHERKYILGNIRAILDELEDRELLKKAIAEIKEPTVVYGKSRRLQRGTGNPPEEK